VKRLALSVVVVTLVPVLAATAHAATGTHNCGHLITDPRGDAQMWYLPTKPYNPEADLLFLDAVTTRSTVDFTATLAKVDEPPVTGTAVTTYFVAHHQGQTVDYSVTVDHEPDGDTYSMQNDDTLQTTDLTGAIDARAGKLVIRVPRKDIGAQYRGAPLTGLGVIVSQNVGVSLANGGFIEQSTGPGHHYLVGYPYGCHGGARRN